MEGDRNMSKLNIVRRCYNCGAILQADDKEAEGYVSPEVIKNTNALVVFCDSCYAKQRYNFSKHELACSDEYLSMLKDARASDALIVCVIDLFSFEAGFPKDVVDIISNNPVLVIANKRDLLPADADDQKLKEYVAHRFRVSKISVEANDVVLTSLTGMADISPIAKEIGKRRRGHDVYLIGASNAGKTLFLSSFLRSYKNNTFNSVVTAKYPGTSIRVMQIPLDSSTFIYDTPGTPTDNSMTHLLSVDQVRLAYPSDPIKPRTVALSAGESLCIGGLARIELLKGDKTSITYFGSKNVKLAKTRSKHAEADFFQMIQKGFLFPQSPFLLGPVDLAAYELVVDETGSRDIGIEGYGWIGFHGKKQTFRIFVPKDVAIYTSRSKIPVKK